MICKDCKHYHDDIAEMPIPKRWFAVRTMFSETCDLPEFADPVDGSRFPCVTARLGKCHGEPPKFSPRDKTPNGLWFHARDRVIGALKRRGLITDALELTDAGRTALNEQP